MIHGLFRIHALRKPNPRFAQVIHCLSGQSMDSADPRFAQDNPWMVPIHGLRRTHTYIYTNIPRDVGRTSPSMWGSLRLAPITKPRRMNIIFFLGENDIHYESDWSVENYEWQCLLDPLRRPSNYQ